MEHEVRNPRGFSWWGPHDLARRKALLLLALVATICAAYVMVVIIAVVVAIRLGEFDSWRTLAAWQHDLGPFGLIGASLLLLFGAAALIAFLAWAGLAGRATRLAGGRPPEIGEAEHAQRTIEAFAIGVGMPTPRLQIVDADAPNGFAAGRPRACAVCLTTGALALPQDELDALCEHCVASVSNRATPLACAAADLVLVAEICTTAIWALSGVLLVSSIFGVPADVVAMTTIAIVLLIVATKPLLAIADRAILRLLDNSGRLADLDTVRVTNQPRALARLLLAEADDKQTVASRWQIAHLWFDPDVCRPKLRHGSLWSFVDDGPDVMLHRRHQARKSLIERARVIVDLCGGDAKLIARLEKLELDDAS
ncbi:MAG: heat shock protein HtpX [Actinomycetota bacterium]|nr:heat shock protein HtpX [Actinomycetota bacterium]